MIINQKNLKTIMCELGNIIQEEVIIEVMDDFLYMSDEKFSEKTKFSTCLQLFMNEIYTTYKNSESYIFHGFTGEFFTAKTVDIKCHTGVYVSASSSNKIQLDAMNTAIKSVIPDRIIFLDVMDNSRAVGIVIANIEHRYKKIIASHLIALNNDACGRYNINEVVAMKNDCDVFMKNINIYPDLKNFVVENITPEELVSGKYDYIKKTAYQGLF